MHHNSHHQNNGDGIEVTQAPGNQSGLPCPWPLMLVENSFDMAVRKAVRKAVKVTVGVSRLHSSALLSAGVVDNAGMNDCTSMGRDMRHLTSVKRVAVLSDY